MLLLGLLLYLYLYHFILVPKKANIHFVRSYSKLGSFGQSRLDQVSVAPIKGLTIWELFKNYIYTVITLYWSKKMPEFILKALNLNLNLHTNLLKVWTIIVVEVCTSFPFDQNGSKVLLLALLLYLYLYHFILVQKKANILFIRIYSKLGSSLSK